jgi:hypothetical protein
VSLKYGQVAFGGDLAFFWGKHLPNDKINAPFLNLRGGDFLEMIFIVTNG